PLCIAAAQPYVDETPSAPVPLAACNAGNAANPPAEEAAGLAVRSPRGGAFPFYAYRAAGRLPDGREVGLVRANAGNTADLSRLVALRRSPGAAGEVLLTVET